MDEQPSPTRQIPVWGWILGILAIVLMVQLWIQSRSRAAEESTIGEVAGMIIDDVTNKLEVTVKGNTVEVSDAQTGVLLTTAARSPDSSFYEQLRAYGVTPEILRERNIREPDTSFQSAIINVVLTLGPILLIIWIFSRGFRQMQGTGSNSIFGFGRSRARNISDSDRPTVTFADVAGVEEAKEEVQEVVQFLKEPERFIQVGARIPKGLLMIGPPGTGKTLLARAIAGEAGVPFYHISGSEFVEMFVGVGASRVRDLFNKAKETAPSIVFVDEIDAVGRQRGAGLGGGHDEREQTLNQILTEMDGFDKETNVIVIAATNRPDVLDPALLRPGRFDRKVVVDLPDVKGREAILKVHARGKPIGKEIDFSDWARLTAGFAGADLENLLNEAAIFAARKNRTVITEQDFQDALDRIVIGPERKSRVMTEADKEVVAYHEAGHAVVSFHLPNTDPVQKITIVPRGRAGGFVMNLPQDRYLRTREYFEDQIALCLGGRAAEQVFFGQVTDGASNDLQQATRIARFMVTQLGMSDEMGLRTYGEESGNIFLGRDFNARDYSEESAGRIDGEVKRILDDNYDRARQVVADNRERVVQLVHKLMEVETLDRPAFEELMNA